MTNYKQYHYSLIESIRYLITGVLIISVLGCVFYQSIFGVIFLSPLLIVYLKKKKEELRKERLWRLSLEFRDGILALSAAMEAGYSAEKAFEEAYKDLEGIYPEDSLIRKEFAYIINQLRMNITVEAALNDLSNRCQLEDIQSFTEVFTTAKRTGGDLIRVIKITSGIISDKIEIKRDIITMITAKRLEANFMKIIPLIMIAYLLLSSPDFLSPLYHNLIGAVIMTVFLIIYLVAYLMVDRIIAIEV